jgi:hypothetical protein
MTRCLGIWCKPDRLIGALTIDKFRMKRSQLIWIIQKGEKPRLWIIIDKFSNPIKNVLYFPKLLAI